MVLMTTRAVAMLPLTRRISKRPSSPKTAEDIGLRLGFRSGLEEKVAANLKERGVRFTFEEDKIPYTAEHTYTPDFKLSNGIYIETKGYFAPSDRGKHLAVKKQRPDLDIRFVFQNPNTRLSSRSKTTYADWCEKHDFLYAKGTVPEEWIREPYKRIR